MDPSPSPNPLPVSEDAFLRYFLTEERALLRYILQSVPMLSDARDVLQETLVTLWAKRQEFDGSRDFLPWAFGIARFKVPEFWRKQPRCACLPKQNSSGYTSPWSIPAAACRKAPEPSAATFWMTPRPFCFAETSSTEPHPKTPASSFT